MKKILKGITWAHTRGLAPLQVTWQVYSDFHPDVEIQWHIRSLHDFGEGSLNELVQNYDFLLIDHPFMGTIAQSNLFVKLDQNLFADILKTLASESVGASYNSYYYEGHQWALPVDAAAQVSAARIDLIEAAGFSVPTSWNEILELSQKTGKVAMALTPMATLGMFFTLCNYYGEEPFKNQSEKVVSDEVAVLALTDMHQLFNSMPRWCLDVYPPAVFNKMCTSGEIWFVPLSYGYVNYSMKGYATTTVTFMDVPATKSNIVGGSTLGGVGIALSVHCQNTDVALDYMQWIAGADCQSTLYALSGGQPANIKAWKNELLNSISINFYENTLKSLENAFVRPRYNGFHHFQTHTERLLQSFLKNEIDINAVVKTMISNYLNSIK